MQEQFSIDGRIRRMTFWISSIVFWIASFIHGLLFTDIRFSFTRGEYYHISNPVLFWGLGLIISAWYASKIIRRFQDINKEKEWALFASLPILSMLFPNFFFYTNIGIIMLFGGVIAFLVALGFLGFHPGDSGDNDYGPPPKEGQAI